MKVPESTDFSRQEALIMIFVSDLMTMNPNTVTPDTPLPDVLATMRAAGCRQLPVVKKGVLVGIITDRDVRLAMNLPMLAVDIDDELSDERVAQDYMTADPITVSPHMPAAKAAALLSLYKFGALPVVVDSELVGIISITDFLDYIAMQSEPLLDHNG
jgi:acetoin utilization protein AcuB